jgi:cation diffusion facilitator family transporter
MNEQQKIRLKQQVTAFKLVLSLGLLVLLVKFTAYALTGSTAILSDALESLINIAASGFALFSVIYGSRIKDASHPYGHGKMEMVAVGFEGILIVLAGIFIIIKALINLMTKNVIQQVDAGIYITAFSALLLGGMSIFLQIRGRQINSPILKADGIHLQTDVLTSLVLIAGLLLFKVTGYYWIDSVLALALALHILISGFKLLRKSLDDLMDRADLSLLDTMAAVLESERHDAWIDIHNLKIQKYGASLHVDCHLTMPFYFTLDQVHDELKRLEQVLNRHFHHGVEVSVHTDSCMQQSCTICRVADCSYRQAAFVKQIEWNTANLISNRKHTLSYTS